MSITATPLILSDLYTNGHFIFRVKNKHEQTLNNNEYYFRLEKRVSSKKQTNYFKD